MDKVAREEDIAINVTVGYVWDLLLERHVFNLAIAILSDNIGLR